MNITRGPYSADVGPVYIGGRRRTEFQIIVSRYGMPVYEQMEYDFEEAMRVAGAYIEWQLEQHADS
jgi:hypothetical protein